MPTRMTISRISAKATLKTDSFDHLLRDYAASRATGATSATSGDETTGRWGCLGIPTAQCRPGLQSRNDGWSENYAGTKC